MQAFLNELSIPTLKTSNDVVELFNVFGICYKEARKLGVRDVKIMSTFYSHEFSPNYLFANWLGDHNADADLRTLINSIFGTTPFIEDFHNQYEVSNNCELKMTVNGDSCFGLGFASNAFYDTLTFSYNNEKWNSSNYDIRIQETILNDDDEFEDKMLDANSKNITNLKHVSDLQDLISSKVASSIENGSELWLRKKDLFPNLSFCESVKSQISFLNSNSLGFQQILQRLFDLQNTAKSCTEQGIRSDDFPSLTTLESDTRLRNFKNELTILCPDNQYRLFSWHSRFTPGAGRIHFIPYEHDKKFLIGSIANQNTIK